MSFVSIDRATPVLRAIQTTTISPADIHRVVVLLMMTLMFGLQSVAISVAITNDIVHTFSAVEHQDTQGISTYHEGCSAKKLPAPLALLESAPLAVTYSTQPDHPVYHWIKTLTSEFAVSDPLAITLFLPPVPQRLAYPTPVFRKDILLI